MSDIKKVSSNPQVDFFFRSPGKWQKEFQKLRDIVLRCGVEEQLRWGKACYTADGHNVVLIHGFKDYCALLFFKGALLKDPDGILVQQTPNVQAARQVRFTSVDEITRNEAVLKRYIQEAIAAERAGLKVALKTTADFKVPAEFQNKLKQRPALKKAFEALTPGRQRQYLLHFAAAKQSQTRESRIEKCAERILRGKGLND